MKFQVELSKLLPALSIVSRVVPPRPTIRALSGVHLVPSKGSLKLRAMDDAARVEYTLDVPVDSCQDETAVLPAKELVELLRRLQPGTLTFDVDPSRRAQIRCGPNRYLLSCLDAADFPDFPEHPESMALKLHAENLRSLIKKTVFVASPDDAQVAFSAVRLRTTKSVREGSRWLLEFSATDGARAAIAWAPCEAIADELSDFNALIPMKTMTEIGRMIAVSPEGGENLPPSVRMGISGGQIRFSWGHTRLAVVPVNAQFPKLENVVPSNYVTCSAVNISELVRACDVASYFSKTASGTYLRFGTDRVIVESAFPDVGHSSQEVQAVIAGEQLDLAFNGRLLIQGLNSMDSEWAWLRIASSKGPAVIMPCPEPPDEERARRTLLEAPLGDREDEENLHIILPLKLD